MPDNLPSEASKDVSEHWHLRLCGQAQVVSAQGQRHTLERRDAALLALLAIEGPMRRNRAMALLWPDEAPEQVRGRLRQRIYALKRRLGTEIVAGGQNLALSTDLRWPGFDAEATEAPLLGDDDHADLPEFAQWLQVMRNRLQTQRRERLAARACELEQHGRLAEAIVAAERLQNLEPLQEHAHRRLMRLHYLRGDRSAALLAFDRCEQLLKDEVGATPSAETLALLAQIDRSQPLVTAASARRIVPASVLRPPRLIGRDAEWARLNDAWEHCDAIVVIGEAGMGKTRLVGDLVRLHAGTPGSAVQISARPGDERVPYALLSRLLRALLAARNTPLPEGIETELARLLPELPQRESSGAGDAAQARFIGAIEATLTSAVDAGLQVVLLDDLHFADTASLEMVQHLSGSTRLRWLTAFRGAEIGPAARALVDTLTGTLRAEPVELQPLTVEQVAELVDSLGIDELDAGSLAGALRQRSGGNPLFLLETLKALLQGDPASLRSAGGLVLAHLAAGGKVERLIEQRIARLSAEAVQLARCAAIAGQDFSAALASHVLGANPLALTDAWLELESAQVLRDGAFSHDLIYEAARASVPEPIARELHRRIAELLDRQGTEPARVAAHWLGAGEEMRAAPHLAQAGRLALRALRFREGLDALDRAQAIYGHVGDADAQCALIDELIKSAVMGSSSDAVQRLVEQAVQNASSDRQRAMALCSLTMFLAQSSSFIRAAQTASEALDAALASRDRACELTARCFLAELLAERGGPGEAQGMLAPIERWVVERGSASQQLVFSEAIAKVLQDSGQLSLALDQWQRAIDIARASGALHAVPNLVFQRGVTLFFTGKVQASRDSMLEGLQLLVDVPEDSMILRGLTIRLQVMDRLLGDYTSCLTLSERVLTDRAASASEVDEARMTLARAYCDLGQPSRARKLHAQAQASPNPDNALAWVEIGAEYPVSPEPLSQARNVAVDAAAEAAERWSGRPVLSALRVLARHAEDKVAIDAARRGLEFARSSGMGSQQVVFQACLAHRMAECGDRAEARWLARECWTLMSDFSATLVYRGQIWRMLVEVLQQHDGALCQTIVQTAADWIFRTAAHHVPAPFRESFLHRNPANAFLLARAREL